MLIRMKRALYGATCAQIYVEIQQRSTEEKYNLTGESNKT